MKYFLVPTGDAAAAKAKAAGHDIVIVPVANIDDALTFLGTIGGQGLPAPAAAPPG